MEQKPSKPQPPDRKPLDPRVKRLLTSLVLGLGFGFVCQFLPEEYRAACSLLGKILAGFSP